MVCKTNYFIVLALHVKVLTLCLCFSVIQKILERSVNMMTVIPEESVFPLMQFAGKNSNFLCLNDEKLVLLYLSLIEKY